MVGVGLSMGGNVIIRNAADMPNFPLKAIVSVNNPFDIWLSINLMRGTPYEKHLANEMKRNLVVREK
jgi:predicted alpha/beta-fold hydrolase